MATGKLRDEQFKNIADYIILIYGDGLISRYKELSWNPD